MSIRYGNKVSPLASRKSSFFKKNRYDRDVIAKAAFSDFVSTSWIRPVDWLTMPTITPAEQKIALLVQVFPQGSNFLAFTVAGDYTVDWGDGTSENVSSGVKAQHEYTYADPDLNATVTSDGYKMAIVVITPQAGQNITSINFNQAYALAGSTFPNSSPIIEILLSCPNLTSITLGATSLTNVFCKSLTNFSGINMGNLTSFVNLFQNLVSLKNASFTTIGTITSTAGMFNACSSLISAPLFDTSSVTSMLNMFNGCNAIRWIPKFDTSSVTNMSFMFASCYSLIEVPSFDTTNVTDMSRMFDSCSSLIEIPIFDTSSVTNFNNLFFACSSLIGVPAFNTSSATSMNAVFSGCESLESVPLFNTTAVTTMVSMFNGCSAIKSIPQFATSNVTNMSYMFASCYSLMEVPWMDTSAVTNMDSMFSGCYSLMSIPPFITSAVTNMSSMFMSCRKIQSIPTPINIGFGPIFDTSSVTTMNRMFDGCSFLRSVPLLDTSSVTIMSFMFANCRSLVSVPLFDTSAVTAMNNMFASCSSLVTIPLFNTSAVTNMTNMFSSCASIVSVPISGTLDAQAGISTSKFSGIFGTCVSLSRALLSGIKYSISFSGCKLNKTELESIFTNLDSIGAASQIVTITSNLGAPTPITLTGSSSSRNITITMANTTGIEVGMQVTGTGSPLTTAVNVSFNSVANYITLNNHGLSNGDEVSFATIVNTTGIVIDKIYYVVGATSNTFQVSSTLGGSALTLVTNGTGTLRHRTEVVSINPNVSVTMSRPMASSGTNSLVFRQLKTGTALLKGWTVTG